MLFRSERFGNKFEIMSPGNRLVYAGHTDERNRFGRKITVTQRDPETGVEAVSHLQFMDGLPVVRSWTEVINLSSEDQ